MMLATRRAALTRGTHLSRGYSFSIRLSLSPHPSAVYVTIIICTGTLNFKTPAHWTNHGRHVIFFKPTWLLNCNTPIHFFQSQQLNTYNHYILYVTVCTLSHIFIIVSFYVRRYFRFKMYDNEEWSVVLF